MRLELATFNVRDVAIASSTRLADGVLHVDVSKIGDLVTQDASFSGARVHLVKPGQRVRLINILDVVEPRHKVSGPGTVFPGLLGRPVTVGQGRTHRLADVAVVVTSEPLPDEPVYWRDSVMDMWGPGAEYSLFSNHNLLVIELKPSLRDYGPGKGRSEIINYLWGSSRVQQYNTAARVAGFRAASYLASCTGHLAPDDVRTYELSHGPRDLPKVAFSCQIILHRVYGEELGWQPTLVHPNEFMDGFIFNPYNSPACGRESTYFFQNHPVVQELYDLHNQEISFFGVLLLRSQAVSLEEKERSTSYAANLLRLAGVQGLVLTWTGSGNPGMDTMMLAQKCERLGIKTTVINSEMARTYDDSGIIYFPSEADAVVCAGNYERAIQLPSMEMVIGGRKLSEPPLDASGPLSLTLRYLYGATNVTGAGRLSSVTY